MIYGKEDTEKVGGFLSWDLYDLPLLLEYAKKAGGPVLELACGAGRVMTHLAKNGIEAWGIEASRAMVAKGLEARALLPPEIRRRMRFYVGDMRSFSFEEKFPLIIVPFHSFWTNLKRPDAERCVRCIVDALAPTGVFLVDTPVLNDEFLLGSTYDWWVETAEKFKFTFRMERYTKPDGTRLGEVLVGQAK